MGRLQLHQVLCELLGDSEAVYFQPPENIEMKYPAIVYQRAKMDTKFAGNRPYRITERYTVTYMDQSPTSPVVRALAELPMCTHSAFFVVENLNHDVFDIFI